MNAQEYTQQNNKLMIEWEADCRKWLLEKKKENNSVKDKATFYKDGVFDPDVWFSRNNRCRPLFILKEVHESPLRDKTLSVDFLGSYKDMNDRDPYEERAAYDLWDGENTWRRLATLAQGILQLRDSNEIPNCRVFRKPQNDINRTPIEDESLRKYRAVLKRIAVINLKKMPGGSSAYSPESRQTIRYTEHAFKYSDKLKHQIEIIDPTIIVCGGTYDVATNADLFGYQIEEICCLSPLRGMRKAYRYKRDNSDGKQVGTIILDMWHPAASIMYSSFGNAIWQIRNEI